MQDSYMFELIDSPTSLFITLSQKDKSSISSKYNMLSLYNVNTTLEAKYLHHVVLLYIYIYIYIYISYTHNLLSHCIILSKNKNK